jgi:hypothetical protein
MKTEERSRVSSNESTKQMQQLITGLLFIV